MDALEDAGASDQDDVQYVGEQNSKSSKKGGRPRDSVREHFTDTGAKDSIKKRAPCKCNYCSQQFTASTAEVATLRDHILHKCKHAPAAARQQLLQQQAQKIDPAAASASAPCCWGQQVPQQQQFRQQLCAAGDRAVLCWQQRERCAARVDRPCPATPDSTTSSCFSRFCCTSSSSSSELLMFGVCWLVAGLLPPVWISLAWLG